jgi:hypothetical protein
MSKHPTADQRIPWHAAPSETAAVVPFVKVSSSGITGPRPLTLPSRGRPQASFACLRPPLMSNVRPRRKTSWRRIADGRSSVTIDSCEHSAIASTNYWGIAVRFGAMHTEPLSLRQRIAIVLLLAGTCAFIPLLAVVRPIYVPVALQMVCVTSLCWLGARIRNGSMVPFWLALLTTIATSYFAVSSFTA